MAKMHSWPDEVDAEPRRPRRTPMTDYSDPQACLSPLPAGMGVTGVGCGRRKHKDGKHRATRYNGQTKVETTWQWRD